MYIVGVKIMSLIVILPYVLIILGLTINITFGLCFGTSIKVLMIKSIFLIIGLTVCGVLISDILRASYINRKKSKEEEKQSSTFEAYIPPITDEELQSLTEEEEFHEINPADLYKKKQT